LNSVSIALVLLLAVVMSGAIARMLPLAIPRPLVQIAIGAAIGLLVGASEPSRGPVPTD
jgi:CPA1 family monovalent cation:H+ antiporter